MLLLSLHQLQPLLASSLAIHLLTVSFSSLFPNMISPAVSLLYLSFSNMFGSSYSILPSIYILPLHAIIHLFINTEMNTC